MSDRLQEDIDGLIANPWQIAMVGAGLALVRSTDAATGVDSPEVQVETGIMIAGQLAKRHPEAFAAWIASLPDAPGNSVLGLVTDNIVAVVAGGPHALER